MAQVNGQQAAMVSPGESRLNTNALGLWGLVMMGVAYMGLALTVYFNVGLMEGITGPIVPLAFAAVAIAMLPTAASFAIMNSRRPRPARLHLAVGGDHAVARDLARLGAGVAYIVGSILQPVMFGLFFNSLLDYFGVRAGYLSATMAGFGSVVVVGS